MRRGLALPRIAVVLFCVFASFVPGWAEATTKILLVVAHPDDEYYFAATVYRMAVEQGARVDELVITDGEGGYRYSTLAEPYYQKTLTVESVGRRELPAIRRREAVNAGKILGIKEHYFLNQKDQHFTTDQQAGVKSGWNDSLITSRIAGLARKEHYAYIFCILPRSSTHGAHQAAASLAATAIQELPESLRPVILGFDTDESPMEKSSDAGGLLQWTSRYGFAFDRTTRFGFQNSLNYQIVVDWMIAEHKSQGLLQTMCEKNATEYVWVDRAGTSDAEANAAILFARLGQPVAHK
jgi:LmbE family N-acetylglucosaminyl deacetylase